MATPRRVCKICGKPLAGTKRATCSDRCRKALQRSRGADRATSQPEAELMADAIHNEHGARSPLRQTIIEELRPVVREAIDEEVIKAIGALVRLTPGAIAALSEDLDADDPQIRQRAYSLVVKYALDNQHVTPPRQDRPAMQLEVLLPRPGLAPPPPPAEVEAIDLDRGPVRRCAACREPKPLPDFQAGAPMCNACLDQRRHRVLDSLHAVREPATAEILQRPSSSGGSEVREAGPGVQPGDVRPPGEDHPWTAQIRTSQSIENRR